MGMGERQRRLVVRSAGVPRDGVRRVRALHGVRRSVHHRADRGARRGGGLPRRTARAPAIDGPGAADQDADDLLEARADPAVPSRRAAGTRPGPASRGPNGMDAPRRACCGRASASRRSRERPGAGTRGADRPPEPVDDALARAASLPPQVDQATGRGRRRRAPSPISSGWWWPRSFSHRFFGA